MSSDHYSSKPFHTNPNTNNSSAYSSTPTDKSTSRKAKKAGFNTMNEFMLSYGLKPYDLEGQEDALNPLQILEQQFEVAMAETHGHRGGVEKSTGIEGAFHIK